MSEFLLGLACFAFGFGCGEEYTWTFEDVGGAYVEVGLTDCAEDCKFRQYFFAGGGFDETRPTVLYIPSAAGQIVTEPPLSFLHGHYNVIYFHIRGTGLSTINPSNAYDRYLRARYVVDDIEEIRKTLLHDKPWAAIYAHSHGAIIGQLYAEKYGQVTEVNSEPKLKKLILSAPPSRHLQKVDLSQRRIKTVENLSRILDHCENDNACTCATVLDENGTPVIPPAENFCFLSDARKGELTSRVFTILEEAQEVGGVSFIIQNYDAFKGTNFAQIAVKKYPKMFFVALKQLERLGSESTFEQGRISQQLAALMIGYIIESSSSVYDNCSEVAGFWGQPPPPFSIGFHYCTTSWRQARGYLVSIPSTIPRRPLYVYGIYDGISTSFVNRFSGECGSGEILSNIAENPEENGAVVQEIKKVGVNPTEEICRWNPEDHKHGVSTLILTGGADPVVAGCQVEHVYKHSLTGSRVWLEFPGMGHSVRLTDDIQQQHLIMGFLSRSFSEFLLNGQVTPLIKHAKSAGVDESSTECEASA